MAAGEERAFHDVQQALDLCEELVLSQDGNAVNGRYEEINRPSLSLVITFESDVASDHNPRPQKRR